MFIQFPGALIVVDVVEHPDAMRVGLLDRQRLAPDHGMLFVFPRSAQWPITMDGMRFPIDILFIDEAKVVAALERRAQPNTGRRLPRVAVRYVLETPAGWAEANAVTAGSRASF